MNGMYISNQGNGQQCPSEFTITLSPSKRIGPEEDPSMINWRQLNTSN